jgi:hypothetical protein
MITPSSEHACIERRDSIRWNHVMVTVPTPWFFRRGVQLWDLIRMNCTAKCVELTYVGYFKAF